jgi:hypothetical protein
MTSLVNKPSDKPTDYQYASCYCEENIYHYLLQQLASTPITSTNTSTSTNTNTNTNTTNTLEVGSGTCESWVCFISNDLKQCPIWEQKKGSKGEPVVWDYHVVALEVREGR